MSTISTELSSLASTLAEVTKRVTSLADGAREEGDEVLATDLFAVERGLAGALRRLSRVAVLRAPAGSGRSAQTP